MIFKAIDLEREDNTDWKKWYVDKALAEGIIESAFYDYNNSAERWWIFIIAKDSILLKDGWDLDILDFLFDDL
jgi:hypothetical protein